METTICIRHTKIVKLIIIKSGLKMTNNNGKTKIISSGLFYIYLAGVIAFIFLGPKPYYTKCSRGSARDKACYSNIRVLQGAVEMYNMDSKTMMTTLDQTILKEGHYFRDKNILVCPETHKEYLGDDLTGKGYIYCDYHGDLEGNRYDKSKGRPFTESEKRRNEINKYIGDCVEKVPYALMWPVLLVVVALQSF